MVDLLLRLFPLKPFRNVALQCLTEIASLTMEEAFDARFQLFYEMFCNALHAVMSGAPRREGGLRCGGGGAWAAEGGEGGRGRGAVRRPATRALLHAGAGGE